MSNTFDYVKYDKVCADLEFLTLTLPNGRARTLALTKLEEFYAWAGKAIRDGQIARTGSAPLQEDRKNG